MTDNGRETGRPRTRRALGRGLDALLPVTEPAGLRQVDIDAIEPNPNQPRQRFDPEAMASLAASVREYGIVQPLLVSAQEEGRFRLIVGERRWQAARRAGLRQVPVVVKDATDRQTLELALIENVQRADLNPLEEAAAYDRLVRDFGLTQQQVADQVGRSRVAVANTVRLLALPETLKKAVVEERVTEGHARALLALPDVQLQITVLERIEREGLTVRQTEDLVRRLLAGKSARMPARGRDPDVVAVEENLQRALGARVSLRHGKRGGRIVIDYASDDEFQSLYWRLMEA